MSKINSKNKGKRGELLLVKALKEHGFDCRRTQQFCGKGGESADVIGLPKIHIECKFVEKLNIYDAVNQAKSDCSTGNLPAVFHKRSNCEWLVTMPLEFWIELYREYYSGLLNNTTSTKAV
ncbi:MAG: hypothetical protein K0Q53_129 [Massilibacillus sp.]|jgi:Holliday junction resolvase|nr:hypothetical protein [Massilibacillus sp.]